MAFWDDFQKNMNKTANASIKTTSKWIEIGKLNVALNAAKLDLNDLYERIGEYVYQNKIVDVKQSDELQELFHEVSQQKMKIREIQAQLNQMRSKYHCEQCVAEIDANTKYCPYCSAPQSNQIDWRI